MIASTLQKHLVKMPEFSKLNGDTDDFDMAMGDAYPDSDRTINSRAAVKLTLSRPSMPISYYGANGFSELENSLKTDGMPFSNAEACVPHAGNPCEITISDTPSRVIYKKGYYDCKGKCGGGSDTKEYERLKTKSTGIAPSRTKTSKWQPKYERPNYSGVDGIEALSLDTFLATHEAYKKSGSKLSFEQWIKEQERDNKRKAEIAKWKKTGESVADFLKRNPQITQLFGNKCRAACNLKFPFSREKRLACKAACEKEINPPAGGAKPDDKQTPVLGYVLVGLLAVGVTAGLVYMFKGAGASK
jgi:hypothetical protein